MYDTTYLKMTEIPKGAKKSIIPPKILYIELNERENFTISVKEYDKS